MPKVIGPLSSFSARGALGSGLVFQERHGVRLARWQRPPTQANTAAQLESQALLRWLNRLWLNWAPQNKTPFGATPYATSPVARQNFIGVNAAALKGKTDLADFVCGTYQLGGLPVFSLALTPGSGTLHAVATLYPTPPGYTLSNVFGTRLINQDPHGVFTGATATALFTGSPPSHTFAGLAHSTAYAVFVHAVYLNPKGFGSYGPGKTLVGTAT